MKVEELNKIYKNAINLAETVSNDLNACNIKHKIGFYNNHEIKQKGCFVKEIYPIPVISCIINNTKIDIGFDVVTNAAYIGFLELTLSKIKILNFDFDMLKRINFYVYGFKNFKEDYYFGNINETKQRIINSKEKKFHIGIDFSNIKELKKLLEAFK